ncbi:MAG: sigma-70 family RNA polymerase sigma factor [Verrucomicrobiota bacterium]
MSPRLLERLYDDHADALTGFLMDLTRDPADARDALQEIFIKLATRPELLDGVREERGFLLRLAHNLAIDLIRRRAARSRAHDGLAEEAPGLFAATSDPDEAAFRDELAKALGALPIDQRTVVHLKLWEGLTFEAIAETLRIPPNTAASRYRYGVDKLRALLRPLYDEIR